MNSQKQTVHGPLDVRLATDAFAASDVVKVGSRAVDAASAVFDATSPLTIERSPKANPLLLPS